MLEDIDYIHTKYGIGSKRLKKLWLLYQKEGSKVLHRQAYNRSDATFGGQIIECSS